MLKPKRILSGIMAACLTLSLCSCADGAIANLNDNKKENTSMTVKNHPAALDIGHPVFKNTEYLAELFDIEPLGVSSSSDDIMGDIYKADIAAGGDSFFMDRVLAREGVADGDPNNNGNGDGNTFMTRGRALYMYTSDPSVIGFGGQTSYCRNLGGNNMYKLTFKQNGKSLEIKEQADCRVNCPSNWSSIYKIGDNLTADVTKFIAYQNVAVTNITLNNTSDSAQTLTVNVTSPFVSDGNKVTVNGVEQDELIGIKMSQSNLTEITTRLTANGFSAKGKEKLEREIILKAGESVELRVVMAFTTEEIPESNDDYVRFAEFDSNLEAVRTQKSEYNLYWAENISYIDVPNDAVKKIIYYYYWLERFNTLDANIPGYDYQYPITIEGVLGYDNAIALTQCMHLQDTKWLRSAYLAYGQLLSVGNSSQSSAFLDNPGARENWNNHYGQYIAESGLEALKVIGGSEELIKNLAYYFECDAKGQLEHYGNHAEYNLIAYKNNYMTGCDADTISMSQYSGVGDWKIHGENAYVWAAADSSAQLYELIGNDEKAAEMRELADSIQEDVLNLLWCEECGKFETYGVEPTETLHNENQPHLVKWTESNNYNYFSVGLVPTDEESVAKYKVALKAFSNGEEFPIFPYYTANQIDNDEHIAKAGFGGSNNFSNINFTVQARLYESALRTYDTDGEYITDDMLALMVEWFAWNLCPDSGDVRYPNNSEFYNIDNKTFDNYYRSWIYHNILGNYIYIFFEDMAGIIPRLDDKIELDPIDFSYDHFMVNNIRYHEQDMTVVYNSDNYYADIPNGFSLYIDGELAFTLDSLAHVVYDPQNGTIEFAEAGEEENTQVLTLSSSVMITSATETVFTEERVVKMLEMSGVHNTENLALGASVEASYTPSKARAAAWADFHRADVGDTTSKAVNETAPDPMAVTDGVTVNMPFWGNDGSKNPTDSLVITLDSKKTVDTAALYFYNDRQSGGYSEPAKYTIEYWDGESWQYVSNVTYSPEMPVANYNVARFDAVKTDKLRFTFHNQDGHYTAVTEIQLFNENTVRETVTNTSPTVTLKENSSKSAIFQTCLIAYVTDDGYPQDGTLSYKWELLSAPSQTASVTLSNPDKTRTDVRVSELGEYTFVFTASDGELETSETVTVVIESNSPNGAVLTNDVAPSAKPESDYTASWENLKGINNEAFEPANSNVGTGKGWGNWEQKSGTVHYVGYVWDEPVTVSGMSIYWYDDAGWNGTRIPASYWIEYLDENGEWQKANLYTDLEDMVELGQYNAVYFDTVTTANIRLYMTVRDDAGANGIYRLKVYESQSQ